MQSWQITLKYQDALYKNIEIMESYPIIRLEVKFYIGNLILKNFLRKTDRKHSVKYFLEFSLIFKAKISIFAILTKSCISVQNKEVQSR